MIDIDFYFSYLNHREEMLILMFDGLDEVSDYIKQVIQIKRMTKVI